MVRRRRHPRPACGLIAHAEAPRAAGTQHPLVTQANPTPELIARGRIEVVDVPNPYGEVIVNGEPRRHRAVKRQPAYVTLHRIGVIDRQTLGALEWYAGRLDRASSGIYRCGLGDARGGAATSHIPVSEAMIQASRDIDWARGLIPADCLRAFDMVMIEDMTFSESARREAAGRYVRASVRRRRAVLAGQFRAAAQALLEGYIKRYGSTVRGVLVL